MSEFKRCSVSFVRDSTCIRLSSVHALVTSHSKCIRLVTCVQVDHVGSIATPLSKTTLMWIQSKRYSNIINDLPFYPKTWFQLSKPNVLLSNHKDSFSPLPTMLSTDWLIVCLRSTLCDSPTPMRWTPIAPISWLSFITFADAAINKI